MKKQLCYYCKKPMETEREYDEHWACNKCIKEGPERRKKLIEDIDKILEEARNNRLLKEKKKMVEVKMGVVKTAGKEMQTLLDCDPAVRWNKVGIKKADLLEDIKRETTEMELADEEDFTEGSWAFMKDAGFLVHLYPVDGEGSDEEGSDEEGSDEEGSDDESGEEGSDDESGEEGSDDDESGEEGSDDDESGEEVEKVEKKKPVKKGATKKPVVEKVEKAPVVKKVVKKEKSKTRTDSLCDSIKNLKKKTTLDEFAKVLNDDYVKAGGKDNLKQSKHIFNVMSPVLVSFGVITVDGDRISPVK